MFCKTLGGCTLRIIGRLYALPGVLPLPKVNNMRRKPIMSTHTAGGFWRMGSARSRTPKLDLGSVKKAQHS